MQRCLIYKRGKGAELLCDKRKCILTFFVTNKNKRKKKNESCSMIIRSFPIKLRLVFFIYTGNETNFLFKIKPLSANEVNNTENNNFKG